MDLDTFLKKPGSAASLAKCLGVPAPLLSQWRTGARPVPADRCPEIEKATSGAVRCEDLRPDVDWKYLRGTACACETTREAVEPAKQVA
jgi:DNA-binding transcriptional regulator YdaS (Cro superfamily)